MKNNQSREIFTGFAVIALTVLALVLFGLGFSTGYYTYGQMNSVIVTVCFGAALLIECCALICLKKFPKALWPKLLTFPVTAALAFGALTLLGDRVEGIGNCILTDYDSGHGGEEAIYYSLGGMLAALAAMVFNIIGAFGKGEEEVKLTRGKKAGILSACAAVLIAILVPSLILGGAVKGNGGSKTPVTSVDSGSPSLAGTYKVTISGAENNLDMLQDYQFICGNVGGLMKMDTRLTLDLELVLNADGTYSLLSDPYVIEAGKRAVIGDDTGLGMVSTMKAEGTYTVNEDGTVTTSAAEHAVFTLELDTYSSQMRSPAKYQIGDDEAADGTYDSKDHPAVLDAVPATVWTVADGKITGYKKDTNVTGTYKVTISGAENNLDMLQDYQFICGNVGGLMKMDTRLTLDLELVLNADGTYSLLSDPYVIEAGKRAVIGDDTGLGMVSTMKAEGTYTVNEDGTVTTSAAEHAVFTLELDTYSSQMRSPAKYQIGDEEAADGTYDSKDYPAVLDAVPETVWILDTGSKTIAGYQGTAVEEAPTEEPAVAETPAPEAPAAESVTVPSDDAATEIVFDPDGTYVFKFAAYNIEDAGTYTYENGILTLINANGAEASAEGDPLKLHYVTAVSDQLTGDYTIPASTFAAPAADQPAEGTPAADVPAAEPVTVKSDDEGTEITFNADGTYRFWFAGYSIEDLGTWAYENGVLTLTDKNGKTSVGEGDPIKLHYTYSDSDQLTGDYTIPASTFAAPAADQPAEETPAADVPAAEPVTVPSDDAGTEITFNPNGTYRFWFAGYSIEDLGTWTYENGVLTLTDKNGKQSVGEGDPIKLHYTYSDSDQLTGDYTIPVSTFAAPAAEQPAEGTPAADAPAAEPVTVPSDDAGTEITFNPDGSYRFWFAGYSIEDLGTWTYENGVLTLVNANGAEASAEGDPLKLHYVTAVSDQLTGDYTIPASAFAAPAADQPAEGTPAADAPAAEPVTIPSDDAGTEITFNPDGTYRFFFEAYNVEDLGTWTYENGILTLVNANGAEASAEGDPLKLHYVTAVSDQLTGDYTIPASAFAAPTADQPAEEPHAADAPAAEPVTVPSDDAGTEITFDPDGTYRFFFAAYNVEDLGTWTYENGILTLTDKNGKTSVGEGDPIKLHYTYSDSDQLTGDYTIPADTFTK